MRIFLIILTVLLTIQGFAQSNLHQANRLYQHKNWPAAKAAYQSITKVNPYHGAYWNQLGYINLQLKDYEAAIDAFEKATPLLSFPSNALYNLACTYALSNQQDAALSTLEKAITTGYNNFEWILQDTDLKSIREHPRFKAMTGQVNLQFDDRIAGWQHDLQYLVEYIETHHFNPFHTLSKQEWETSINQIKHNIPHWSDGEITMAVTKLVAKINDGHTNLLPFSKSGTQRLPIFPYLFQEGVYVKAAQTEYKEFLGSRILQIGSTPIETLVEASFQYIGSDNIQQKKMMAPWVLQLISFLETEKAIQNFEEIPIQFEMKNGEKKWVNVKPSLIQHLDHHLPFIMPHDWEYAHQALGGKMPLFQKNPHDLYWFEYLEKEKVIYFQYNAVIDKADENIANFSHRLFKFIDDNEVNALVIDIRNNLGGNGFLNRPIIKDIIKCKKINQKGKLFTIIGRQTFSAAMIFSAELEQWTETLFVGEPTGSKPNNYGEHNPFRLPYSGLEGSYSSRYFQLGYTSDDLRPWISPHLVAEPNLSDYLHGVDPSLNAIKAFLGINH